MFYGRKGGDIMITKKDLIIAVLATFCLTSALFIVIPTKGSSNSLPYDPWVDLNGDGKIDIYDITWACELYDTSGDPTRNVNVTNFPLDEQGNLKIKMIHDYYCLYNFSNLMPGESWHLNKDAEEPWENFFAFKELSIRIATNGTAKVRLYLRTFVDCFNVAPLVEIYKRYEWASSGFDLYVENEESTAIWFALSLYVST